MARQIGTGQFDPVIGEVTNVIRGLVSRSEFTVPIVICLTEFVRDISDRVRFFRGGGAEEQETLAELSENLHLGPAHKCLAAVHEAV